MRRSPMLPKLLMSGLCASLMTGCGGAGKTPVAPVLPASPPTTLTGNWLLVGSRAADTLPLFSTTLVVEGSQITGQGNVQFRCSPTSAGGGFVSLAGTIAADGSFQSTFSLPGTSGGPQFNYSVSLAGSSPSAADGSTWNGTYQLTVSGTPLGGTAPCTLSQGGPFTATKLPPLSGVYTGVPVTNTPPGVGPVPVMAFALTVAQGEPTLVTFGRRTEYQLPLAATVAVTGSSCFHGGTTVGSVPPSSIAGDTYDMQFVMDDGSQMAITGYLLDATGNSLQAFAAVLNGACQGTGGIVTLTKSAGV